MNNAEKLIHSMDVCDQGEPCSECVCKFPSEACTDDLRDAVKRELNHQNAALMAAADCMSGTRRRYVYFCVETPPGRDTLPRAGLVAWIDHERRYIMAIDRMALGLAIYDRVLSCEETAKYRLCSAPRDGASTFQFNMPNFTK